MYEGSFEMDDGIEQLLADDEIGIKDEGFSQRTRHRIDKRSILRRGLLFMAGGAGFAVALDSVANFVPVLAKSLPSAPPVSLQLSIPGLAPVLPLTGGLLIAVGAGACLLLAMAIMDAARD